VTRPGYLMLPWQDEPLFVESEYADGRGWVAVQKPFRVPVAKLISEFLAELPTLDLRVEDVMLQREICAPGRRRDYRPFQEPVHYFIYRKDGDTRLDDALAMLNMAIFFVEQVKDIIEPMWRYEVVGVDWAYDRRNGRWVVR